jgi:hypothetical protein
MPLSDKNRIMAGGQLSIRTQSKGLEPLYAHAGDNLQAALGNSTFCAIDREHLSVTNLGCHQEWGVCQAEHRCQHQIVASSHPMLEKRSRFYKYGTNQKYRQYRRL